MPSAGSSFLQVLVELVVRESRPSISTEFGRVIREVNLGLSFEVRWRTWSAASARMTPMATAISIQHTVGGNLAEILDSIAFTIRERVRIKGEIHAHRLQRLSGYVVGFLPIALAGFSFIAAPGFMFHVRSAGLHRRVAGRCCDPARTAGSSRCSWASCSSGASSTSRSSRWNPSQSSSHSSPPARSS